MKYKIYKENGYLGVIAEDGTKMTPAVYDEIRTCHGRHFRCRVLNNWDWFFTGTGEATVMFRDVFPHIEWEKCGLTKDRSPYDAIKEFESHDITIIYVNGKFGYKDKQGKIILQPEFDYMKRWRNCNVIETRKGNDFHYFDLAGNEILTDRPESKGLPYWEVTDTYSISSSYRVALRRLVEKVENNHTFESEAGLVCFESYSRKDFLAMLKQFANILPVDDYMLNLFADRYSDKHEANAFEARIAKPTCDADWRSIVERCEKLSAHRSSQAIDVFLTNERTPLGVNELYLLKHIYDTKMADYFEFCFALGCDNSLTDNEVRWIHLEFSNEPPYEEVCINDEWREALNCGDPWEKVKDLIETPDPQELIVEVIRCLYTFEEIGNLDHEEVDCYTKCLEWAFERTTFPNRLMEIMYRRIQTPYSFLVDSINIRKLHNIGSPIFENWDDLIYEGNFQIESVDVGGYDKLGDTLLLEQVKDLIRAAGALTTEELFEKEREYYANCDQNDYSIINHWKEF